MINGHVCQLCGEKIEDGFVQFIKLKDDIPFCPDCSGKIKAHMRRKRPIVIDLERWAAINSSPIELLRKWPEGRKFKNRIYWP
jgi:DNA-directed RNA polymerase subunit RPC12/RpoP